MLTSPFKTRLQVRQTALRCGMIGNLLLLSNTQRKVFYFLPSRCRSSGGTLQSTGAFPPTVSAQSSVGPLNSTAPSDDFLIFSIELCILFSAGRLVSPLCTNQDQNPRRTVRSEWGRKKTGVPHTLFRHFNQFIIIT